MTNGDHFGGCVMETKWTGHRGSMIETKWLDRTFSADLLGQNLHTFSLFGCMGALWKENGRGTERV